MVPIGPECHHDHPTGDPHPLASCRLPSVLALEIPPPWRSTANRRGSARADPAYFQHFTGEEFFQHEFPHERSDLSHWRKRLGNKLELLLAESLRVAHESGALRTKDLARVTVYTTVQPKNITFPTDAKLVHAAIKG